MSRLGDRRAAEQRRLELAAARRALCSRGPGSAAWAASVLDVVAERLLTVLEAMPDEAPARVEPPLIEVRRLGPVLARVSDGAD